jgi:hypothetical protein
VSGHDFQLWLRFAALTTYFAQRSRKALGVR